MAEQTYQNTDRLYPDRIMSGANGAVQASPIQIQYGELNDALSMLNEAVASLETRLAPVLGPAYPQTSGEKSQDVAKSSLSPFAEGIRSDTERAQQLISRIQYITARLEV